MADYLRAHSAVNDRIGVLGSEPQICFYAHRRSAGGYLCTYALVEPQPYAPAMQREMIQEIEAAKPEYLVWVGFANSWMVQPSSDPGIFRWFNRYRGEFYEPVAQVDTRADGETIYSWNGAVTNHPDSGDLSITIYKRTNPSGH